MKPLSLFMRHLDDICNFLDAQRFHVETKLFSNSAEQLKVTTNKSEILLRLQLFLEWIIIIMQAVRTNHPMQIISKKSAYNTVCTRKSTWRI